MKVGIIGLLRRNFRVTYYTNKEIWNWCFERYTDAEDRVEELLTIKLAPYRPNLAKRDPHLSHDVREARRRAGKDTTVIVNAPTTQDLCIDFSDYLFLVKPPEDALMETKLGAVLTAQQYRSKIFVKGMFVEERGLQNSPSLHFGINFSRAAVDRDRRSLNTDSQATMTLVTIWNDLIENDRGDAAEKYLELLLKSNECLETSKATRFLSGQSAEKLLQILRSRHPNSFFYSSDDPNAVEVTCYSSISTNDRPSASFTIVCKRNPK